MTDFFDEPAPELLTPVGFDDPAWERGVVPRPKALFAPPPAAPDGLDLVESMVLAIPLGDVEHLAATIGKLKALGERLRQIRKMYDEKLLERIDEYGPVTVGQIRYYAGFETETINNDTGATLCALAEVLGGDVEAVGQYLCSQPFKAGACRSILPPDDFNRLFTVVEKAKAKEGKPVRKVLAANTQFSK